MNHEPSLSILLTDRELSRLRTTEARAFLGRNHREVFPAAQLLSAISQMLSAANLLLSRNDDELNATAEHLLFAAGSAAEQLPLPIISAWREVLKKESQFSVSRELRELSLRSRCGYEVLRAYQSFYASVYSKPLAGSA